MNAPELIQKARAGLILDQPFFASILLKMRMKEDHTTPTIWIDGKTIGYNPAFIETLDLETTKGILAHEIEHIIFLHHLRRKNRDFETWNKAGDHAINGPLKAQGFKLPPDALNAPEFLGLPTEEIFNTIWNRRPAPAPEAPPDPNTPPDETPGEDQQQEEKAPGKGTGTEEGEDTEGEGSEGTEEEEGTQEDQPGKGNGKGTPSPEPPKPADLPSTGEVRDYPDPDPAAQREAESELKQDILNAARYAKKHGKLPADLEKYIEELTNPRLPWKEILARFLDTPARNDYTWTRPNTRYLGTGFYLPSLNAPELGNIALAVDVSGSIDQIEIKNMVSEAQGILTAYPGSELTVIFCNAAVVGTPQTLTQYDELKEIPRPGGGTDFRPPFQWVEKEGINPKALVYFTDGECNDFPETAPDFPVLWVLTQEPRYYPWNPPHNGETVFLTAEDREALRK